MNRVIAEIESYENIITESGVTVTLYVTPDYNLTPNQSLALIVDSSPIEILEKLGEQYGKPWTFHYVNAHLNEFEQLYQTVKNKTIDNDALEVKNKINIIRSDISKAIVGGKDYYIWKLSFSDDSIFINNSCCEFNKLGKEVFDYFTVNGLELSDPKFKHDGGGVHSWHEVKISGWTK